MYDLSWMKLPVCVQYGQKEQQLKKDAWNSGNSWNYLRNVKPDRTVKQESSGVFALQMKEETSTGR